MRPEYICVIKIPARKLGLSLSIFIINFAAGKGRMGRKNKGKKTGGAGQGSSSQEAPKPLSKEAKKDIADHIKSLLESRFCCYR